MLCWDRGLYEYGKTGLCRCIVMAGPCYWEIDVEEEKQLPEMQCLLEEKVGMMQRRYGPLQQCRRLSFLLRYTLFHFVVVVFFRRGPQAHLYKINNVLRFICFPCYVMLITHDLPFKEAVKPIV